MIDHTIRIIKLKNGEHEKIRKAFRFSDHQYDVVSEFFFTEADQFKERINEILEPIQNGETDEASFAGNKYGFVLFNDSALIYDQMSEPMIFAQISQDDFFDLLDEWHNPASQ